MKILSLGFFIFLEIIAFSIIVGQVSKYSVWLAGILTVVFIIWIVVEVLLELIVGTTINLFKHIFLRG